MTGPGAVLHPSYGMVSIVKPHEYVFFQCILSNFTVNGAGVLGLDPI